MADRGPQNPRCGVCPEEPAESADMYCNDCKVFLCTRCFKSHKKTPSSKYHNYISSDVAVETLLKDIDNKNIQPQKQNSQVKSKDSATESASKILTESTLEKVMAGPSIKKQMCTIRFMKHNFREVIQRIKPVKTISLNDVSFRLGVVNGNIWVTTRDTSVTVFNQQLIKVKEHNWPQVPRIITTQQITDTDVMLLADNGVHVTDTEGQYKYKVMDGDYFTDISTDGNITAVIDSKQNKITFLTYKDDEWQSQHVIRLPGLENDYQNYKTLQLLDSNTVMVSDSGSHKVLKVNIASGQVTTLSYGTGTPGGHAGLFSYPFLLGVDNTGSLIVCDINNQRFQVVDVNGKCHIVRSVIKKPNDIVVVGNYMYISHGSLYMNITQYQI